MNRSQVLPLLLVCAAALVALFAGYQIAAGGAWRGLQLALIPVAITSGLLVFRYPHLLGFAMIAVFFSNLDAYISYRYQAHTAVLFLAVSAVFYGVTIITRAKRPPIGTPLKVYFAFFIVVATVAALQPENNSSLYYDWVRNAVYGLNAFLFTYLVVTDPKRLRQVATVITFVAVAISVMNTIEFFDRSLLDMSAVQGRSASLLANANASAACILAGFVISYLAPVRFLLVLRLIMFLGMYTTFSRAALILFLMFGFYMEFLVDRLTPRRILVGSLMFIAVAGVSTYWNVFLEASRNRHVSHAYNRVVAAQSGRFDDDSSVQRVRVLRINFERFLEHPIGGGQLGRSLDDDSPHNQFLLVLSEHGAIGFALYMSFLWVLFRRLRTMPLGLERRVLSTLFAFQVANMFFTHNQYHFRFYIMSYAFIAVGAEIMQRRVQESAGLKPITRPTPPRTLAPFPMRQNA